jgi:SAM-dependent methyltransferase
VAGHDINPEMVVYAKKRIGDAGLQNRAKVMMGDMRLARFDKKFDAAINSINSLGYLISDDDILAHFRNTGESLKREGIYVIHIGCAWDRLDSNEDDKEEGWILERDGIRIKTIWDIEKQDSEQKLSHQVCRMEIDDHGEHIVLEDHHKVRLWLFDDLKRLIHRSGKFRLEAIYDEERNQIPLDAHITGETGGETGNLHYVLKVL